MAVTRERLEHLIARSADIVVGTDRRGTVVYYNDGAKKTLGYAPEEVLGAHVRIFYPDLDEARRVMKAMRSAESGGEGGVETFRTTFVSRDPSFAGTGRNTSSWGSRSASVSFTYRFGTTPRRRSTPNEGGAPSGPPTGGPP